MSFIIIVSRITKNLQRNLREIFERVHCGRENNKPGFGVVCQYSFYSFFSILPVILILVNKRLSKLGAVLCIAVSLRISIAELCRARYR